MAFHKGRGYVPYQNTKVHWAKTQAEITALLEKHGIRDSQFTYLGSQKILVLQFTRPENVDGVEKTVGVRLVVPDVTEENRSQKSRAVYYYLKAKLESLSFGFLEFMEEFFPHLVITDGEGRTATVYEILGPQYKKALGSGQVAEMRLLPSAPVSGPSCDSEP